ncbi:MAG: hypothetical protein ABW142_02995 [Thermoleophilaceae bacterium]
MGAFATATVATLIAVEVRRARRSGSDEAVADVARVARAGYRDVPTRENSMFNLLTSFATTFLVVRTVTYRLRTRRTVGPFRTLRVGRRHIHHYVPGIVIALASGAAAIVTRDEHLEPVLAVPFGIGMGLTLDESALLLELEDVYWTREGLLSVQITLTVMAMLGALALALRFLRRGEELVLVPEGASAEADLIPRHGDATAA